MRSISKSANMHWIGLLVQTVMHTLHSAVHMASDWDRYLAKYTMRKRQIKMQRYLYTPKSPNWDAAKIQCFTVSHCNCKWFKTLYIAEQHHLHVLLQPPSPVLYVGVSVLYYESSLVSMCAWVSNCGRCQTWLVEAQMQHAGGGAKLYNCRRLQALVSSYTWKWSLLCCLPLNCRAFKSYPTCSLYNSSSESVDYVIVIFSFRI